MKAIPLFPLSTLLFPKGRLPLQIFEPRYLDLVSRCLKEDNGFGVVWLREGSEVASDDEENGHRFAPLGCFAKIVDWDQLSNGLLGITIEGQQKFRLLSSHQRDDKLHMGEVEWLEDDPFIPMPEGAGELKNLLRTLMEHPHVARLQLDPEVEDVATLSFILAQLLPIDESIKFELLSEQDPLERLDRLMSMLDEMSQ
jgi:Lon protease-like protein